MTAYPGPVDMKHHEEGTTARLFIRNSVMLVSIEMVSKVLGVVFFALLARFLGARELGIYGFGVALANFFVLAPRFGFDRLAQKEIGRTSVVNSGHLVEISVIKGAFSIVAFGLFLITLIIMKSGQILILSLITAFIFTYAYIEYIYSLFRGLKRAELEVMVRTFFSVSNLAIGVAALQQGYHLPGVVAAQLGCLGASLLLALFFLRRFTIKVPAELKWRQLKKHVTGAAPFAGILLALYFSNQMGVLILAAFKGEVEVGYFAAAMKLFDNLTLIAAAVMGAFLPMMSEFHGNESSEAFSHALRFTMKHLFVLAAPVAAGTVILALPIATFLYGSSFAPAAPSLRILGAALIFNFWNYAADTVLIAVNREGLVFRLTCLGAFVHIAANLILVPSLGSLGAAWATLVTQTIYFVLLFIYLKRYVVVGTLLRDVLGPAWCSLIMGAILFVLDRFPLVVAVSGGAAIYLTALLLSGSVSRAELGLLRNLLHKQ
ncbi:MAG: flippase [Deltaproteobacteria bacterium]|nr:flippase [Deltaproteobacteria bacterium]